MEKKEGASRVLSRRGFLRESLKLTLGIAVASYPRTANAYPVDPVEEKRWVGGILGVFGGALAGFTMTFMSSSDVKVSNENTIVGTTIGAVFGGILGHNHSS